MNQTTLDDYTGPLARDRDPQTSKDAASVIRRRTGSLRWRLLRAYAEAGDDGLTDGEAGAIVQSNSAWKRCSELRNDHHIDAIYSAYGSLVTRRGSTGQQQMVCRITSIGKAVLRDTR